MSADRKTSILKEDADLPNAKKGDFIVFYLTKHGEEAIRGGDWPRRDPAMPTPKGRRLIY